MAEVQIIGWDDDYRWEEERRRVKDCVKAIAEGNGFAFALVEDMMMKTRYRGGSNCVNVQFRKKDWMRENGPRYVPARLYFNEDCDLTSSKTPNPELLDEVNQNNS